ncbi:oxygen-independent coproporphyrinogen III oxidase [Phaeobacter sp.]|uniref:oxygen-independent coproporphyrinogen III oxidase n=1 Tax=Phaeobacter sp. TaxID=1902409 RepID=UPI0025FA223F|nr:oxygen-independent coproporphyrinogen III oxidase [Phaeobacter sp.]
MKQIDRLRNLGLFDSRVPRYTSYPTAPIFGTDVGGTFQEAALANLPVDVPVSVYIHIPFCERLCWFCACRTQGTRTLNPVENYIGVLEQELSLIAKHIPDGLRMGRLHWGGGTPTILSPELIHRLAKAVKAVFQPTEDCEFSVEIDPTLVDRAKIAALAAEGMNRASIGIQDFDTQVQTAIGREQPFSVTKRCVDDLRAAGIHSLNADLVYGLPHQDKPRITDTVNKVLSLAPDRVALFGYAHVPWMAKRQQLIDDTALPSDENRFGLAETAAGLLHGAGFESIGIDHFAKPEDGLCKAKHSGHLRRNFQGYTDDHCPTLVGIGASSISRFASGYVQNAPATAAYIARITEGQLPGARGYAMQPEDKLRARTIEMLMCDFTLDLPALTKQFGDDAEALAPHIEEVCEVYGSLVTWSGDKLTITPAGRPLTRMIASTFDTHKPEGVRYSQAS